MMTDAQRAAVLAEAQRWLRTPWRHGARVRGAGVDCARLLQAVYVGAGIVADFPLDAYPPDWMLHRDEERFLAIVAAHMDEVASPLPGDVALWKYGRTYSHGAIVVDWPRVIHAHRPERMVAWGDAGQGTLRRMAGDVDRPVRFFTPRLMA